MSYLLDTSVLSEARRSRADRGVRSWLASVSGTELYISVLAVGEIRQGIERLRGRDPGQAAVYEAWLLTLYRDYRDRIVPVTPEIAEEWGRLNARVPIAAIDGLMAATAIIRNLTLITRDVADVARWGVRLLNPFASG